jgi:hypothetical protein
VKPKPFPPAAIAPSRSCVGKVLFEKSYVVVFPPTTTCSTKVSELPKKLSESGFRSRASRAVVDRDR